MTTIGIRDARSDDARGIAEAHVYSWQAAYRGQVPDGFLDGLSVDRRERVWTKSLSEGARGTIVADLDSRIVGFSSFGPIRDKDQDIASVGEVYAIYLLADFWNRGVGRRLMEESLSRLSLDGYISIKLWVLDTNYRAKAFCEKLGFKTDGRTKTEKRDGFDLKEIRYGLNLKKH